MSKITTEICKDFLINHFKDKAIETNEKDWKRISRHKEGDMIVRDLSHPTMGVITLVEENGILKIKEKDNKNEISIKEEVEKNSYFKKFTKEEVLGAKKNLRKLIRIREGKSEDDEDELFETKEWLEYQHALPSQFTFHFPCDEPHGLYHNEKENITAGLDSPMFFNGEDSYNIIFKDKNTDDSDLYTSDCLRENILPSWTDFIDEECLEVTGHSPQDMTVKEFMHVLFDLGFEYKISGEFTCLFKEEIKEYLKELESNLNIKDQVEKTKKPKF